MPRLGFVGLVLVLRALGPVAVFAADATAVQTALNSAHRKYTQMFAGREGQARTFKEKLELAQDLIVQAQDQQNNPAYLEVLCLKAYDLARGDRQGYAVAAQALKVWQDNDPRRQVDAMEKLVPLYERAYYADTARYLGLGAGLADVHLQIAQALAAQLQDPQGLDGQTADLQAAALQDEETHYRQALGTLDAVLRQAGQMRRRLDQALAAASTGQDQHERMEQQAQQLSDFIQERQDLPQRIRARVKALQEPLAWANTLRVARAVALDQPKDTSANQRAADLFLIDSLDPARAQPFIARAGWPKELVEALPLLTRPLTQVNAPAAHELGVLVGQLLNQAPLARRPGLAVASAMYFQHEVAQLKPDSRAYSPARAALATAFERLRGLGIAADQAQAPEAGSTTPEGSSHSQSQVENPQAKSTPTPVPPPENLSRRRKSIFDFGMD